MDTKIIQKVSAKVYRQFPEVTGLAPKLRTLPQTGNLQTYMLTYQGKAITANGKSLSRWVKVTVDANGKILKITTSR